MWLVGGRFLAFTASKSRDRVGYVPFLPFGPVALSETRKPVARKPLETIGDHVSERRLALGLSQARAALVIGVSRDALARWEIRPVQPNVWLMPSIVDFLGYDPQPPATSFADCLKRARRALGLNKTQFAGLIGAPESTLHAWKRGIYEPTLSLRTVINDRLERLADTQNPPRFNAGLLRQCYE